MREWTSAQRAYDDLGRHTTSDTSAPMDIRQVKGTKGKGKKGKRGKGKKDLRESDKRRLLFSRRPRVLWQVGSQASPVQEVQEGPNIKDAPQSLEKTIEAVTSVPRERVQQRNAEKNWSWWSQAFLAQSEGQEQHR